MGRCRTRQRQVKGRYNCSLVRKFQMVFDRFKMPRFFTYKGFFDHLHMYMWHITADISTCDRRGGVKRYTLIWKAWFLVKKKQDRSTIFLHSKRKLASLTFAQILLPSFSALFVWSAMLDHVWCLRFDDGYSAVSPWLQFSNKMAGDSSAEAKQVLLATEAELYIEELKTYPLKEIGSPK